jgi:hypothetical protein
MKTNFVSFTFAKLSSNFTRIQIRPDPYPDLDPHLSKMLDPDPHTINADPKHWASPASHSFFKFMFSLFKFYPL